ncbi:MAG: hypothetical protein IKU52_04125 [Clostridia bacterium]|nr:hypothetical protein [Clostridia bacterium]
MTNNTGKPQNTNRRPAVSKGQNVARGSARRRPAPKKQSVINTEVLLRETVNAVKNLMPMLSVKQDKVTTVKTKNSRPFPVGAVVIVTICTLLLMFTVLSYVQINEYTIAVASLRGELTDLVETRKELELSLEEKKDMLMIEEKAGELGMVKADQLTKKHISLDQEDKIEVVETEPGDDMTVVSSVMSAIASNFRGFWEYMS